MNAVNLDGLMDDIDGVIVISFGRPIVGNFRELGACAKSFGLTFKIISVAREIRITGDFLKLKDFSKKFLGTNSIVSDCHQRIDLI